MASTASQGGPASISSTLAVGQSSPTPGQMGSASSHAGTSSTPSAGGPTSTGQHLQGTPTSDCFLYVFVVSIVCFGIAMPVFVFVVNVGLLLYC